ADEEPRTVSVPSVAAGGTALTEGVVGELLIRTFLEGAPESAGAGWGGDLYRLYDVGGRTLLVWRSVWGRAEDERLCRAEARQRFERKHGAERRRGGFSEYAQGRWRYALGEEGGTAVYVSSDDARAFDVTLAALTGLPRANEAAEPSPREAPEPSLPPAAALVDNPGGPPDNAPAEPATAGRAASGQASAPVPQGGSMASSTPGQSNLGMAPNVGGLLCYVPCCIGLIFSVVVAIVEK